MNICEYYKEDKFISIQHKRFDENIFESSDYLGLFLINSGSLILKLNGKECIINGRVVVCTNTLDEIKLLHQSEAVVDVLRFSPDFLNVGHKWRLMKDIDSEKIQKELKYPNVELFFKRSQIYNGILLLDEEGYGKINELMKLIEHQMSKRLDSKWLFISRSSLVNIINILNLYYKKHVGDYVQDSLVWDICQYINSNLDTTLSLKVFCKRFSINRTSLSERFKSAKRMTISEYIKEKRIGRAKHLLAFTEFPLSEIAEKVGYCDQAYLSKVFIKSVGVTPTQYRKSMKII